jgi:hypothetical protein
MKLKTNSFAKMKQYVRNISVHNKQKGKHGKAFEKFLADYFCFPTYEQHNAEVDFPIEVVSQGNVPSNLIGDWEVKYYNKNKAHVALGDIERKIQSIDKGLILAIGLYDETPENLVGVKFYKITPNKQFLTMRKIWLDTCKYIKDRSNSIHQTKEKCKKINRLSQGAFSVCNTSRPERWSESKQRWETEARQCSLQLNLSQIAPMF